MNCRNCGEELQDPTLLICPHCGQDPNRSPAEQFEDVPGTVPWPRQQAVVPVAVRAQPKAVPLPEARPAGVGMSSCAWGVVLLTLIVCVAVAFIAAGLGGVYQGLQRRNEASQARAYEHYSRGMAHLEAGENDLAEAEFEQAIRVSPGTSMDAYEELKNLRAQRRVEPTPTSAVVQEAQRDIMAEAKVEYDAANWSEAIIKLEQVQSLGTESGSGEIKDMLYRAYMEYGKQLLDEERPEEARRSFQSALDIRPDDADAQRERQLISDYLTASSYLGANWEEAITAFTNLYRRNKDYLDVAQKLFESRQSYGDLLVEDEKWCEAAAQYAEALALSNDEKVRKSYDETGGKCETGPPPIPEPPVPMSPAEAAPSPTAIETSPTDETEAAPTDTPAPATEAPAGTKPAEQPAPTKEPSKEEAQPTEEKPPEIPAASGVLAYSSFDPDDVRRIYQLEIGKGTDPSVVAQNGTQPACSIDGQRLAYLSWASDMNGLQVADVGGRNAYNVTKYLEDGFPSWGPDGTQLVLSSMREADRRPRIFTTWADGMTDSVQLGLGERPSWSSTGWIAYHGCDPGGGNCGVWKMAPNGQGQVQVALDNSDTMPAWSHDGSRLAFMSARDGNWEVYTVGENGGEVVRLTNDGADDGLPAWSPDDKWIAFVSSRGGLWSLYIVPATGGEAQKLWDVPNIGREWMEQRLAWR